MLDIRTKEMKKIASESAELIERLKVHKSESDLDSFVYQATFISEKLQSVAVDMNRILETPISEEDWERFNLGQRGVFVRKMLGFREKSKLSSIKEKYQLLI